MRWPYRGRRRDDPRFSSAKLLALLAALNGIPAAASTFTVLNTNDLGADSLRAALTSAQTCAGGAHTIAFDVPGGSLTGGVAIITPASALPAITCAGTTIDGTTQTTNEGNTNNVTLGTGGTVGTGPDGRPGTGDEPTLPQLNGPEVEIVGSSLTGAILVVTADNVTIRGLSLHGGGSFGAFGTGSGTIDIQSGSGTLVEQNILGASATSYVLPIGSQTQDNLVRITGGTNITIEENLMGFARWRTIVFLSSTVGNADIRDNEVTGSFDGIDFGSPGIGPSGIITITRNFIHDSVDNGSGSSEFAFFITQEGMTGSTSITGNAVRNVDVGAALDTFRPVLFQHNIVSGGVNDAIIHFSGLEPLTIDRNAIFDNLLGIDLGSDGLTPNDGVKSAASINDGMDYPVITSAAVAGGFLSVAGYVGSNPAGSATFAGAVVQIFKADNNPPNQRGPIVSGDGKNVSHGEGAVFIGTVTADGMGLFDVMIAVPPAVTLLPGDPITATALDALVGGNSSEFGPNAHLPSVLDIDADGATDPLTDGLLALRLFFGFTGATLINGAVGGGCMRCTADSIADHITTLDRVLDIDDNDELNALTDGLLILRYLFGFTGATLTNGAVGGGCGRCDAAAIEPYLQTLDP